MDTYNFYRAKGLLFPGICPICKDTLPVIRYYKTRHGTFEPVYFCRKNRLQFTSRYNTIFQEIYVSFSTFDLILQYYLAGFTANQIYQVIMPLPQYHCSLRTIRKYVKMLRDIIHIFVQEELLNCLLPGPVEVDEACLYRARKSNIGRLAKTIYWVFGIKCRTTGKTIIYPVLYRTKNDLIPLILLHVTPGAIVYSDRFSSYFNNRVSPPRSHLAMYGYRHFGINHTKHFVSEVCNLIHTNTIERTWRSLKEKLKYNKPRIDLNKHVSEFVFESWIPKSQRYEFMLGLIAKIQRENL